MDDDEHSGQTSRSKPLIAQMKNHYAWKLLTVWEVAEEVEISIGSCHTILM
jgi:hypothetical protein